MAYAEYTFYIEYELTDLDPDWHLLSMDTIDEMLAERFAEDISDIMRYSSEVVTSECNVSIDPHELKYHQEQQELLKIQEATFAGIDPVLMNTDIEDVAFEDLAE